MPHTQETSTGEERKYFGHILRGNFSDDLKIYVAECFNRFTAFEQMNNPSMPYISAWHEEERRIWYEFVSKNLMEILHCRHSDVAEIFRNSIIDYRIYRYGGLNAGVVTQVLSGRRLTEARDELREKTEKAGVIEAVYQISRNGSGKIWLKDQAAVKEFPDDRIFLCSGCLTIVTKEIEAADERERLVAQLRDALSRVKKLGGLIPICASCKKIRDDKGYWKQVEVYIRDHSDADFSHSICPDCYQKATKQLRLEKVI